MTLDLTFHALSDPTRRALVTRLKDGPARVTVLAEAFDMSLNGVSKHIKVLEKAGLVERHIDGRTHLIRLCRKALFPLEDWLSRQHGMKETPMPPHAHLIGLEERKSWINRRRKRDG